MATKGKPFITVLKERNDDLERRNRELQDRLSAKMAEVESLKVEVYSEHAAWVSCEQDNKVLRKVILKKTQSH